MSTKCGGIETSSIHCLLGGLKGEVVGGAALFRCLGGVGMLKCGESFKPTVLPAPTRCGELA